MKSSLKRTDTTISYKYSTPETSVDPSYIDYGNRNNTVTDGMLYERSVTIRYWTSVTFVTIYL